IYLRKARYIDAEKVFLKVINTNPDNAEAYERLAYLYYVWSDANKESKEHFLSKGLEAITKALKLDPYSGKIYNTNGLILIEIKDYDLALSCFNKALEINSNDQEAYTNKGILFTKLDKYETALNNFEKAIHIQSDTPRPYKELGKMLAEVEQDRQAIEYLKKSRFYDIFTTYQEHYLMATLQEKMGNLNEAIEEYTETLAQKPDYVDCYTHIAKLFETLGDDKSSIEAYRKAISLDYTIMENFIAQSKKYIVDSDYLRARPLLKKILNIEPQNRYGFEGLCCLHYLMSVEGKLDLKDWYNDKLFLRGHIVNNEKDTNLRKLSWVKFHMAKQGLTEANKNKLIEIMRMDTNTPEDYSAKGEALFLYENYYEANNVLNEAIDKYASYYTKGNSYEPAVKHILWAADRLFTYHEFLASKNTYDKAVQLNDSYNAVNGLTLLVRAENKALSTFKDVYNIPETPNYDNQIIERLKTAIRLYPQNTEAHYQLALHYAIINKYEKAIDELIIYKNLIKINPYSGAPSDKKIDKLIEKYFKIINARTPNVIIKQ
ncbi:MAG: tetratricopeptide repeat protein, partial [Vampirovibrionia bacterium]